MKKKKRTIRESMNQREREKELLGYGEKRAALSVCLSGLCVCFCLFGGLSSIVCMYLDGQDRLGFPDPRFCTVGFVDIFFVLFLVGGGAP